MVMYRSVPLSCSMTSYKFPGALAVTAVKINLVSHTSLNFAKHLDLSPTSPATTVASVPVRRTEGYNDMSTRVGR
jgi:hypothetical protein